MYIVYILKQRNDKMNSAQYETARNLVGTEINELEYIDHIVMQDSKEFFQVIHLNGNERLVEISEHLSTLS